MSWSPNKKPRSRLSSSEINEQAEGTYLKLCQKSRVHKETRLCFSKRSWEIHTKWYCTDKWKYVNRLTFKARPPLLESCWTGTAIEQLVPKLAVASWTQLTWADYGIWRTQPFANSWMRRSRMATLFSHQHTILPEIRYITTHTISVPWLWIEWSPVDQFSGADLVKVYSPDMAFGSVGEGSASMQHSMVVQEQEIIRHPRMLVAKQFLVVNELLHKLAGLRNHGSIGLLCCPHDGPLLCRLGFWPRLQVAQRRLPCNSQIHEVMTLIQFTNGLMI